MLIRASLHSCWKKDCEWVLGWGWPNVTLYWHPPYGLIQAWIATPGECIQIIMIAFVWMAEVRLYPINKNRDFP